MSAGNSQNLDGGYGEKAVFLIAGVQPKTRRIDDQPQRCPACGLLQAYPARVDHYLSLFFIPLIPVKQGDPFLLCEHCQRPVETPPPSTPQPRAGINAPCVACGKKSDASFQYCPHCGQRRR
ncbi:MAG: hypothetical protein CSA23_07875 [Deltaproteobacteria bacterium]|nr:MAG: hypothetical protein CSA23_07875 [Deltaproteobacteria bacterium]